MQSVMEIEYIQLHIVIAKNPWNLRDWYFYLEMEKNDFSMQWILKILKKKTWKNECKNRMQEENNNNQPSKCNKAFASTQFSPLWNAFA